MGSSDVKDTRAVVKAAKAAGWIHPYTRGDREAGGHNQTWLACPHDGEDRCLLTVYSTPKRGQPNILRRYLRKCPHGYRVVT